MESKDISKLYDYWPVGPYRDIEIEAFELQNQLRTDPKSFIPILEKRMTYFKKGTKEFTEPGEITYIALEGIPAYKEAIKYLEK